MSRLLGVITKKIYVDNCDAEECCISLLDDEQIDSKRVKDVLKTFKDRCKDCKICREYKLTNIK